MQPISIVIKHAVSKIGAAISSAYGKVLAIALCLCEYFAEHKFVVFLVVATTFMDAIWGISVSIKEKKFTLSELLRNTIGKLAVYGCALFVFVGLDKFHRHGQGHRRCHLPRGALELISFDAHPLPGFPVLKTHVQIPHG